MSYDIYGHPLRRGYCEVHSYVHQEYPCELCITQDRARAQDKNAQYEYHCLLQKYSCLLEFVKKLLPYQDHEYPLSAIGFDAETLLKEIGEL